MANCGVLWRQETPHNNVADCGAMWRIAAHTK